MSEPAGLSDPGSAKGRLQRAALRVMCEHQRDRALPTSIRFVFYELEQRGEASKRERVANLSEALMVLRELGLVRGGGSSTRRARLATGSPRRRLPTTCVTE
jgi:hypothetical protein